MRLTQWYICATMCRARCTEIVHRYMKCLVAIMLARYAQALISHVAHLHATDSSLAANYVHVEFNEFRLMAKASANHPPPASIHALGRKLACQQLRASIFDKLIFITMNSAQTTTRERASLPKPG